MNDNTAFLVVLFGKEWERFLVRFNPAGGRIKSRKLMRYQNGGDKILWIDGTGFENNTGKPCAVFHEEKVAWYVNVSMTA